MWLSRQHMRSTTEGGGVLCIYLEQTKEIRPLFRGK